MEMKLDKWQEEVLNTKGHLLLCTGRQVGKTMIFSRKVAAYMLDNPDSKVIVVSLTEDQAQLMIIMILQYLEQNYKKLIAKKAKKPTKRKIFLTNGSSVIARPVGNTGDAVRGFTGDVLVVDEASRMPEMMWAAAKPTLLTTGGEVWMCSTPFGKQGYFYECYQNKHKRFKVFHVNSEDVVKHRGISERWTQEIKEASIRFLEEEKKDMTALQYQQEYLGRFIEDIMQLFPDELIHKAQIVGRGTITPEADYYLGVDIARMGEDESAFQVLQRIGKDTLIHIENQVTRKTLLTQTAERIFGLNKVYNPNKIYVDPEGIGVGVFDMLITDERTRRKTEALRNSKKIIDYKQNISSSTGKAGQIRLFKIDLYMNLLRLMEQEKIKLLTDDTIFQSLKSVQYEYTTDTKGAPMMKIFGNYTHITEGLIRAAWCIKDKSLNLFIM